MGDGMPATPHSSDLQLQEQETPEGGKKYLDNDGCFSLMPEWSS